MIEFVLTDGCPRGCSSHGQCSKDSSIWSCRCHEGWGGHDCSVSQETNCNDEIDNDAGRPNLFPKKI